MAETTINSQAGSAEPGLVRDTHEPKGVLQEEPEATHLSGRGGACHCRGDLQRNKQEDAKSASSGAARASAAHRSGQYRQQCSGSQESTCRGTAKEQEAQQRWLGECHCRPTGSGSGIQPNGQAGSVCSRPARAQPNMYGQQPGGQPQVSPEQEEAQQLAAKERELAYNSRFASNLVYSHRPDTATLSSRLLAPEVASAAGYQQAPNPYTTASSPAGAVWSLLARLATNHSATSEQASIKHAGSQHRLGSRPAVCDL